MEVLLLTIFLSLLLAGLFLLLYLRDGTRKTFSTPEQDALRPFENEKPVSTHKP